MALVLLSMTPGQGSCAVTTCTLGSIPAGGQVSIVLLVQGSAVGPASVQATASGSITDPVPGNSAATANLSVTPAIITIGGIANQVNITG